MSSTVSDDQPARPAVLEEIARGTKAAMDTRLAAMDGRVDHFGQRLDRFFLWMLGIVLASFAGLLGTMVRGLG